MRRVGSPPVASHKSHVADLAAGLSIPGDLERVIGCGRAIRDRSPEGLVRSFDGSVGRPGAGPDRLAIRLCHGDRSYPVLTPACCLVCRREGWTGPWLSLADASLPASTGIAPERGTLRLALRDEESHSTIPWYPQGLARMWEVAAVSCAGGDSMSLGVGHETMNRGAEIHSDVKPTPQEGCSPAGPIATAPDGARSGWRLRPGKRDATRASAKWTTVRVGQASSLPHSRSDACQYRGRRSTYGKSTTSWMSKLAVCSTSSRTMFTNPSLGVQLTAFMCA